MASKTRNELRELVRAQMDMDEIELPDSLLDPWLDDAYERTISIEPRWPFLEHQWTITTVASQVAYTKASLAAADASSYEINYISSVVDLTNTPAQTLMALSHDRAEQTFGLGTEGPGVPAYWSEWGSSVSLWPAPSVGRTVRVRGYRKPAWADGSTVAVDADTRLHMCLFFFACAMGYAQQEDDVLSGYYLDQWQQALRRAHDAIMAAPQRRPVVLSGNGLHYVSPPARLAP